MRRFTIGLVIISISLGACQTAPKRIPAIEQQPIRAAAVHFTDAIHDADESNLLRATTIAADPDTRKLADDVLADTLIGRRVQLQLNERFHDAPQRPAVVGSDAWLDEIQEAAIHGTILQAGDRARIDSDGHDGILFLRHIDGTWKVELIPTLVAESGGRTQLADPIIDYRFNVGRAVNQHLLARLQSDEFHSFSDYQRAKDTFWLKFMTIAAKGEDPHDKLLPTLPPIPKETPITADR